jgi:putative acetyltransferase
MQVIRPEQPGDFTEIRQLIQAAFQTAHYAEGDEQDFVENLRETDTYLPELALVGEDNGRLIAHVMLTRLSIDTGASLHPVLLLACVAVAAEHRNRGIGLSLIEAAFTRARNNGHGAVILLGDPAYYARLGFVPCSRFGIVCNDEAEQEYLQARELVSGALCGISGMVRLPG